MYAIRSYYEESGRICNHRCEDACNRGQVDEPINIHALKRFVTDSYNFV